MFQDFKDLLFVLNELKVKYLVVGGQAVIHYAQPRATKDLDILIQPSIKNALLLFQALKKFGAPLSNLTAADFIEKGTFFSMGAPPVAVDIMSAVKGLSFETAWKNRSKQIIDQKTGLTAHFISRDDLIKSKLAAGRPQDIADVAAIRSAKKITKTKPKKKT